MYICVKPFKKKPEKMKSFWLKTLLIALAVAVLSVISLSPEAIAVKKSKKSAMPPEELEQISVTVNKLVKKVYSSSLFSPSDNDELFDAKIKIDREIQSPSPDETFAEIVYKIAFILKEREFKNDAIDYYRTITDKFPESAYVPKATESLRQLGVVMQEDSSEEEE